MLPDGAETNVPPKHCLITLPRHPHPTLVPGLSAALKAGDGQGGAGQSVSMLLFLRKEGSGPALSWEGEISRGIIVQKSESGERVKKAL